MKKLINKYQDGTIDQGILPNIEIKGDYDLFNKVPLVTSVDNKSTTNLSIEDAYKFRPEEEIKIKTDNLDTNYRNAQSYLDNWSNMKSNGEGSKEIFDSNSSWFGTNRGYSAWDKLFHTKKYKKVRENFINLQHNIPIAFDDWKKLYLTDPNKIYREGKYHTPFPEYKSWYTIHNSPNTVDDALKNRDVNSGTVLGIYTPASNTINTKSDLTGDTQLNVLVHELQHARNQNSEHQYNPMQKIVDNIFKKENQSGWSWDEWLARRSGFLQQNNINPNHKITDDDLNYLQNGINNKTIKDDGDLFKYATKDQLKQLLNLKYKFGGKIKKARCN